MFQFAPVCLTAGTPLLTPEGSKPIEQFRVGERILSRSEFDPAGPVTAKLVEEVFERLGLVIHLHVGGQVIRTTPEHPFYAYNRGWVPAGALEPGDLLVGHDGQWTAVEEVYDTGEYETVYNLRVAEYHTYFVGDSSWRFSVWAHNAGPEYGGGTAAPVAQAASQARGGTYVLRDPATGRVMRSGRTGDLKVRQSQHARHRETRDLEFEVVHRTDVYAEQRGLEQVLHDTHNPPLNRIRPIRPDNPRRQEYLDAANDFLRRQQGGN